jgi:hypothetical protein
MCVLKCSNMFCSLVKFGEWMAGSGQLERGGSCHGMNNVNQCQSYCRLGRSVC